ncbi:MAG: OmpA family protein [Campylobacterales bacterium]|nr:OmpA family protein [Campylobacterales bacterium]
MKKMAFSALLAATLLGASDYHYEITPVAGYLWNSTSDETTLYNDGAMGGVQNRATYGLEMQMNGDDYLIKPEISVLYGRDRVTGADQTTGVLTTMFNGVYEVDTGTLLTPFAKAGAGYEWYTNTHPNDYDGFLVDAGLGTKIALAKNIALKLEGLYMFKWNRNGSSDGSNGEVHNVAALAGLTFAFGEKEQPAPAPEPAPEPVPEPKPVVVPAPVDSDRDGVYDPQDQCPNSPAGYPVDARGCNLDSDRDGVLDPADKCPNTPEGFKVDNDGCPIKATLHLNFAFDSNGVDAEGSAKVNTFAEYLKGSPGCKVTIVGHTDSTGSEAYNQKLSERRAEKVKEMLIADGIDEDRLFTDGEGETMPVASNETEEGRAENRRIEIELCK